MARISQDEFSGQTDASEDNTLIIKVDGQDTIEVPSSEFISNAEMSRDGQDLMLETADGQSLAVKGYFSAETTPMIESPDGAILSPNLVNSFLSTPAQYAQSATMSDESPVGAVEEISGDATVIRTDGSSETITLGTPIFQGDVIETTNSGAVNIVFIDETSMAVSQDARLSVDEYQFDPSTESGATNLSVLRGVFVFTSGLIGRDDPDDVLIDTPVGSIGIRGTIIAGNINPGGVSEITVVEGAIVVKNGAMEKTLSQQFETVKITGFNDNMQEIGVQDASDISKTYGSVSDVVPKLFSSINDAAQDNTTQVDAKEEAVAEDNQELNLEEQPVEEQQMQDDVLDGPVDPALNPMNMNHNPADGFSQDRPAGYKGHTPNGNAPRHSLADDLFHYSNGANIRNDGVAPFTFAAEPLYENTQSGTVIAKLWLNNVPVGTTIALDPTPSNYTVALNGNVYEVIFTGSVTGINVGNILEHFTLRATIPGAPSIYWNFDGTIHDVAIDLANLDNGPLHNVVTTASNPVTHVTGDFDGDGIDDTAEINAGNIVLTSGSTGTAIVSPSGSNYEIITSVGDINNDGFDDLIAGLPSSGVGSIGIINGGSTASIATVPNPNATSGDQFGHAVAGIGDIDGDGQLDYAVSAPGTSSSDGRVYVYHGGGTTVINGGAATGDQLGQNIYGLGDFNGDGLSDVLVTADPASQKAMLIFGHATTPTTAQIDISDSVNPASIVGGSSTGDVNGDGFDDFALAIDDGTDINTYVVFGRSGVLGTINFADLENPDYALKINHAGASGNNYQITALGDIDGDGFDDIQVGIDGGAQYKVYGDINDMGSTVPYATDGTATDGSGSQTSANGVLSPDNSSVKSLVGDVHFMDNGEVGLSMRGGASNNHFSITGAGTGIAKFTNIDGGAGDLDTIRANADIDFSAINFEQISQIERLQIGADNTEITLTVENLFNLLKSSDTGSLRIESQTIGVGTNRNLEIVASTDYTDDTTGVENALKEGHNSADHIGSTTIGAGNYEHYQIGGYDLYIENTINTTVV